MCDVRLELKGRTGHVRGARVLAWGIRGLMCRAGLVPSLGRAGGHGDSITEKGTACARGGQHRAVQGRERRGGGPCAGLALATQRSSEMGRGSSSPAGERSTGFSDAGRSPEHQLQRHLGAPRQPPGCRRLALGLPGERGWDWGVGCVGGGLDWEWQCCACCGPIKLSGCVMKVTYSVTLRHLPERRKS
jgi:hypothetical protein